MTGNLEAYRHYFVGLQLVDQYRLDEGWKELGEAARLDPGFSQAFSAYQPQHDLLASSAWALPRSLYLRAAAEERLGKALLRKLKLPVDERGGQ